MADGGAGFVGRCGVVEARRSNRRMRRLRPIDVPLALTGPVAVAKGDCGVSGR